LTRAAFGLHVTGRIDAIEEIRHRQGQSKGGSAYEFWQQSCFVTVGGEIYEVNYRADKDPGNKPLVPFELDDKARIRVSSPRVYNGKVSFDAVV
jgi:hypothetical protein